jgi:diaminopimelate epimerase
MRLRFSKMHGAGNDFLIVDCRRQPLVLDAARIARLADRHFGIGFDQLLTIEPADAARRAFRYRVFNADGSPAGQCGNGARCVAAWLRRAGAVEHDTIRLQSPSGPVDVVWQGPEALCVAMGVPSFAPSAIPLAAPAEVDPYRATIADTTIEFGAVSIGNPHALIEVDAVATAPLATLGAALATHPLFPRGCNVGFAERCGRDRIRLRVFERGVGETLACGSGACAAVAILRRRGKLDADVAVELPGGTLGVRWDGANAPIWLSGPAEFVFEGECEA